ncbi:MAG TPA: hypothetical protein VFT48_08025 [Pyrinomonadaceae bacterium]|nr:hypothetical protein [Pyrinomonadaceae bacterium]
MTRTNGLLIGIALTAVLFSAGCKHLATRGASIEKNGPPQPFQISEPGIDAAEPAYLAYSTDGRSFSANSSRHTHPCRHYRSLADIRDGRD